MSKVGIDSFSKCAASVQKFFSKINKEPQDRRTLARINKLLVELGLIETEFNDLRIEYNKVDRDSREIQTVKTHVVEIEKYLFNSRKILLDRLKTVLENSSDELDNEHSLNMSEKFDLRTAASLLPPMDGTEDATKQLIDAIELYNGLLDADGKKLLVTYVLKVKISQSAKMRLDKAYNTVEGLISDMKKHLLTKKSAAALATELHSIKQEGRSIDNYAKNIEDLFLNLTLAQADGNDNNLSVLRGINEKLAIHAFSNGLKNSEVRTVIKARDYSSLKDAILGAKEEEKQKTASIHVNSFHMRSQNNSTRFSNRGNRPRREFYSRGRSFTNNYRHIQNGNNTHQRNANNNNSLRGQGRGASRYRSNYRGQSRNTDSQRAYIAESTFSNSNTNNEFDRVEQQQRFFRSQ